MVKVSLGNKKKSFPSITEAHKVAAEKNGIDYMTLYMRLRNGWTLHRAMNTPTRKYGQTVPVQVAA